MKQKYFRKIILSYSFLICLLFGQELENLSFGDHHSFDLATWNIEWFPKNGQVTVEYVTEIINLLDLDILAIQEIDDVDMFNDMLSNLPTYSGYLDSYWFAGLGYIYNTETVEVNNFYEIYTTSEYWNSFPRSPMVMDFNFRGQNYLIINNHFKCCGDGIIDYDNNSDEEFRRYMAINLLKDFVDENLAGKNVIILGDLNDDIAEQDPNNVFQDIIDDNEHYYFTDMSTALGNSSDWSYPSWPSHLDHILVTNELFNNPNNLEAIVIKVDQYLEGGWYEYDQNISDHRPVALKISFGLNQHYDLNNDGEINEFDLQSLISFVMNGDGTDEVGDFNFDQKVNIFDLLLLTDFLQNY